ncbi:glycosyltransferase [Thiomicrorhabdus sp. zzn3]|uniref:glycosyltransferase n=1 Tax=Thiomicrorhabdus sp. zzn3 TaxID=3039775 RepID=UPI002436CD57|nr:glycosyltransferase [Thiomicrorhabdus sp. zzn3]MDG6778159.1 glycosyltransferase [Thiomicrorhabdus sp. zzn3]
MMTPAQATPPSSLKLLIIGYVWPEPASSAAGVRMTQLIQLFQSHGWQITFASPAKLGDHRLNLQQLGIHEQPIELNNASFDAFIDNLQPQAVLFDRFMMEEQFGWRVEKQCPQALRILNTEDLHSLRESRHRGLKALQKSNSGILSPLWENAPQALYQRMAEHELTLREIAAIQRSDLTLMISEFESRLLTEAFQVPEDFLFTLPFLYSLNEKHPLKETVKPYSEREHFIFIGNFRHAPNWDAVLWLKQSLWPQIHRQLPHAELHVYGAYPAKKVTDLHNPKQGFYIKGWAPQAKPVFENAKLLLAPLRFGAGIKGKLAEAMLYGTPSVTTPIGAESMIEDNDQWPGAIAQTEAEFVAQAVEFYHSPEKWHLAQKRGVEIAQERYLKAELGEQLMQRIEAIRPRLNEHRKQNFTGLLLRHHHHKSTQYMAQWIESKNRLREITAADHE